MRDTVAGAEVKGADQQSHSSLAIKFIDVVQPAQKLRVIIDTAPTGSEAGVAVERSDHATTVCL
ncbi:MAG: hypothetical protein ACJ8AH_21185 [Stellaceae bacterium]